MEANVELMFERLVQDAAAQIAELQAAIAQLAAVIGQLDAEYIQLIQHFQAASDPIEVHDLHSAPPQLWGEPD